MKSLTDLDQAQLASWIETARSKTSQGKVLDYVPLLQTTDPDAFALCILSLQGEVFSAGDREQLLPLMSLVKPFLLLYLLSHLGATTVFEKVGKQPSNYAFNSLTQLRQDRGFPRNPMLNSGAMVLASLLPGKDADTRCEKLRVWLNKTAGCQLELDRSILNSVQSLPNRKNQSLARELFVMGYLKEVGTTVDTYNHLCCLAGNVTDLAKLGILLLQNDHGQIVQELMLNCGLYQASAEFALKVGFPTKSGVSGVMLSIVPNQGAIACYSPPLDPLGNSVVGLSIVEAIAHSF
ncbi:glutaminase [Gloeocapsa sp. PCC 73106]|uniref:glutaminase n=1 Tax=Gloeocapsa sp. PCC 73106 TaxID=102232 RepID=UPI0002ABC044|nr:glutaminase [Gloeocapsa sp. PCC 73106]ELR98348.1 glutaminase [Gloeocapsa sp. PCC 73106]